MKIQIIIEDTPNGHVRVTYTPKLAEIMGDRMNEKSRALTPAETYAFIMADAVKKASDNLEKYDKSKIVKPGDFL